MGTRELVWAPGTTRVVRGSTELQLGCGDDAWVVSGMTPARWRLVERLERGVHPGTPGALLDALERLGAVTTGRGCPAPAPAPGLDGAAVAVVGGRGLGAVLATTVAGHGAGTVALVDDGVTRADDVLPGGAAADDVGRRLTHVAAEAVHRTHPHTRTSCPERPDLVVCVAAGAHDAMTWAPLVQAGTVHLPVLLRDDDVRVGPLVVPGEGPCLHCVDLHHLDVDPGWEAASRALRLRAAAWRLPDAAGCATVTGTAVRLLDLARACPAPAAGASAVVDRWGEVAWERWTPHPACGCTGWPPEPDADPGGSAPVAVLDPPGHAVDAGATMAA